MTDVFSGLAQQYDCWFDENPELFQSEVAAVRSLVSDLAQSVEIGVGTGRFAQILGCPEGVEPSQDMAEMARLRGIRVHQGTAEKLPLKDQTYKLAMMITVDCFLEDIPTALREIKRVLKPDGALVMAFLNKETEIGQVYEKNKHNDQFYKHAHFHSAKEICKMLIQSGFKVENTRQTIFSFEPQVQTVKTGTGEGVFTVLRAVLS